MAEASRCIEVHTLEDPHSGREVVDPPGGPQSGDANRGRGNKIVGEGVVQVALDGEQKWHGQPSVR